MFISWLKQKENYKYIKIVFILSVICWFSFWAFNITTNLASASSGPDEQLRILVPTFIYEHHQLPTGYDSEVIYNVGNWSYAFYPQVLGAVVSAIFMSIVGIFSNADSALVYGARLASVFFGVATVYITGLIVRKLLSGYKFAEIYSYMAMILLAFWPQFAFLSAYINNDIVALFGVSLILYAAVLGSKDKWNIKNGILMGIGFSVCLLGYTNSYGFILFGAVFFLVTLVKQNKDVGVRRSLLLLAVVCLIPILAAGPFYVRNALIYKGDFLGLTTFKSRTTEWELKNDRRVQTSYVQSGENDVLDLVRDDNYWQMQQESFIGKFGYMTISPSPKWVFIYKAIAVMGVVGFVLMLAGNFRKNRLGRYRNGMLFGIGVALACVVTLGLSTYYSLTIDIQPQGRYIIYIIVPLVLLSVLGIKYLIDKYLRGKYKVLFINLILTLYILNSVVIFGKYIQ